MKNYKVRRHLTTCLNLFFNFSPKLTIFFLFSHIVIKHTLKSSHIKKLYAALLQACNWKFLFKKQKNNTNRRFYLFIFIFFVELNEINLIQICEFECHLLTSELLVLNNIFRRNKKCLFFL